MKKYFNKLLIVIMVAIMALTSIMTGCTKNPTSGSESLPSSSQTSSSDSDINTSQPDEPQPEKGAIKVSNPNNFTTLPLGSISPSGWLEDQMHDFAVNATIPADQLFPELSDTKSWSSMSNLDFQGQGYYVKGLVHHAYQTNDSQLIAKAEKWMAKVLGSQSPNGDFGPEITSDLYWFARMLFIEAVRGYYEATDSQEAYDFLDKFFKFQNEKLKTKPLTDWGQLRVGDNLSTVLWYYTVNPSTYLLELAKTLNDASMDYLNYYDNDEYYHNNNDISSAPGTSIYIPMHGVNIAQNIKTGAINYQNSKAKEDYERYFVYREDQDEHFGNAIGMLSGSEFLMDKSSTQPTELCSIVERIISAGSSQIILGDPSIGDEMELITFNGLIGAHSSDFSLHSYYNLPNQAVSTVGNHIHNVDYDTSKVPSVVSGMPCCRYNQHSGLPYFLSNMYAKSSNGIAVMAYSPSKITTDVGGTNVKINQVTNYPFEDNIDFDFEMQDKKEFDFTVRIPSWAKSVEIKVNDKIISGAVAGDYFTISNEWKNDDTVSIVFSREPIITPRVNNSVSISYGPLVYSLDLNERMSESVSHGEFAGFTQIDKKYSTYEVFPQNDWNYAIDTSSIEVVKTPFDIGENPFTREHCPLKLTVKGKTLDDWTLNFEGSFANEPPLSPVASNNSLDTLTLLPYGAQSIRITYFPQLASDNATVEQGFVSDYTNDFEYYTTTEGHKVFGENISINDGKINIGHSYGERILLTDYKFVNFELSTTMNITSTSNGDANIILGVNRPGSGADNFQGYGISVRKADADTAYLQVAQFNGFYNFKADSVGFDYTRGQDLDIKVRVEGQEAKIFVNNQDTAIMTWKMDRYASGQVGFRSYDASASFANVVINDLDGNELYALGNDESFTPNEGAITDWEFFKANGSNGDWKLREYWGTRYMQISTNTQNNNAFFNKEIDQFILDFNIKIKENGSQNDLGFSVAFFANNLSNDQSSANMYLFTIKKDKFEFSQVVNGTKTIIKTVNKSATALASMDLLSGEPLLYIKVVSENNQFKLSVNNFEVLSVANPNTDNQDTYLDNTTGKVGFLPEYGEFFIDNLEIRSMKNTNNVGFNIYEAEDAEVKNAQVKYSNHYNVTGNRMVGMIDNADGTENESSVKFNNVKADVAGTYKVSIWASSDMLYYTDFNIYVNDILQKTVKIYPTNNWECVGETLVDLTLNEGNNTITFKRGGVNSKGFAQLDKIIVYSTPLQSANNVSFDCHDIENFTFDSQTLTYSVTTTENDFVLKFTNNSNSTISVLNQSFFTKYIKTTSSNHFVKLVEGENTIQIKIVSADGKQEIIYTLVVTLTTTA